MPLNIPQSMCNKLKQIKKTYEEVGLKEMFKHAFYVRYEEILNGVDMNIQNQLPFNNGLKILPMEKKDSDVLAEYYLKVDCDLYPRSRIDRYFSNGCKCFIAMKNNEFIGHMWWGDREMRFARCDPSLRYVGETYELKDDDSLGVDLFIVPGERGSGTALEFFSKLSIALNDLGYNRHLGVVQPGNRSARWLYKLFGSKDLQKIVVHRILNYLVLIGKKLYISPHHFSR